MSLLKDISNIGSILGDDENITLRKQFMIYQGLGMSLGGILWGSLLVFFGYSFPSITPYGYVVLTSINFYIFYRTKNFAFASNFQTVISMFLPFILQWTLGGFVVSGGVMLWSILALYVSISYQNLKSSILWLVVYIALIGVSFWFDDYFVHNFNMGVSANVSKIFQISNVVAVTSMILLLFLYFVTVNMENMEIVKQTYSKLIISEKLAVLGQLSAGVAHEVNTPLGAIKSSAEESSKAFEEILKDFIWLTQSLSDKDKDMFVAFVATSSPSTQTLSTIEEREIKKRIRARLDELGVTNSRFIADRLVQVGIYEVTPALERISKLEHFEKLMMITYNILNQQRNNQTIQLAVDKASRIVKALKTYLHNSAKDEVEPINIRNNIETVLTIYHNRLKQGVQVIKNYEEVPEIIGHPDQLNQVWTNLIVNAVQAMNSKGILTIELKSEGEFVVVKIKDTGKGIPKEIQSKIFDPFFTTKISGEGSGLGLDIIKRIVNDHGATISFDSTEGEGTTFYVKLPVNKTA
ncbi:MAG: GHKL domain-containing protein [Bacteroidetes bacterium]|nr:GHKL domain-containing protein [Bacteroidota bacterium]